MARFNNLFCLGFSIAGIAFVLLGMKVLVTGRSDQMAAWLLSEPEDKYGFPISDHVVVNLIPVDK